LAKSHPPCEAGFLFGRDLIAETREWALGGVYNLAMKPLKWECVESSGSSTACPDGVARAKVPGGWLVRIWSIDGGSGITFLPDLEHKWDVGSLE
jgi:hypothetical protein